jgi:carboxyl-terminal processing protease
MRKLGTLVAGLAVLLATAGTAWLGGCASEYDGFGWAQPTSPEPKDPLAPAPNGNLTQEQKEKLLDSVTDLVRERAYATGVDFAKWSDHLKKHQAALDRATNMTQFSFAINRALNEFGISHIDVMSPRTAQMQHAQRFGGIGITAENVDNGIRVTSVRDNEPAAKAGIKSGDVITEVDGVKAELGSIRGEVGTDVKLTVLRADGGKTDQLRVRRAEINTAQAPRLIKISDEAAVVRIDSFTDGYDPKVVTKVMKEAAAYPYLVIDLRSNGGGAVTNFINFLSMLLPKGTEVGTFINRDMVKKYLDDHESNADGKDAKVDPVKVAEWSDRKVRINRNPVDPYPGKVAVLIDRGSASASEIVAAALRELREAPLVGGQSAGAVLMSQYVKMDSGFEMKVPTSDYVTIKGLRIEGSPLQPDVKIGGRGGWRGRGQAQDYAGDKTVQAAIDALRATAGDHAEQPANVGDDGK